MRKEATFNMQDIREAAKRAREEIKTWPAWQQQAAREISKAASSEEAWEVLENERHKRKAPCPTRNGDGASGMIGYFSSFRWSRTQQAYVVCHTQPEMVPPPQHRGTGAETRKARKDFYIFDLGGRADSEPCWSSYPRREKLPWSDDFLTAGLARAILTTGYTGMVEALQEAKHQPVNLSPHKWYTDRADYPTLWDHLLE